MWLSKEGIILQNGLALTKELSRIAIFEDKSKAGSEQKMKKISTSQSYLLHSGSAQKKNSLVFSVFNLNWMSRFVEFHFQNRLFL